MKQKQIFEWLRIFFFAAVMIAFCVVGFILPLRPEVSEEEGRVLAEFPAWDAEAFADGRYTSDISLWYSDTYPGRDELIALNAKLRGLYGIKTKTASSVGVAEEIETDGEFVWDTSHQAGETTHETVPSESEAPDETSGTSPTPDIDHEVIEGYLVDGNSGYELFYFNQANADRYVRSVVQIALQVEGRAQVYAMVTPMSYAYGVPADVQKELGASDCRDAIDWFYNAMIQYGISAKLSTPIIPVDAYSALEAHKEEYIFFRTDHHWTALGAYYASRAFLDKAEKTYPTLDSTAYTSCEIPDFVGSLARHTQSQNPALYNNPDVICAYVPNSVNAVTITTNQGETLEREIVNTNKDAFSRTQRYRCFIDGDYPFSVVHNESVGDGSAILLIKESYGNAFTPMLVDSYEYVYVMDYRWFRTMSVSDLVETYDIDTILFVNNPVAVCSNYNVGCLEKLVALPSEIKPQ